MAIYRKTSSRGIHTRATLALWVSFDIGSVCHTYVVTKSKGIIKFNCIFTVWYFYWQVSHKKIAVSGSSESVSPNERDWKALLDCQSPPNSPPKFSLFKGVKLGLLSPGSVCNLKISLWWWGKKKTTQTTPQLS
jgi:hypothetical protein